MATKLVAFLALLACISYCSAIKCYQCASYDGKTFNPCNDPFTKDQTDGGSNTNQGDCPADKSWCVKQIVETDKNVDSRPKLTISRTCGNKPDLKAADVTATTSTYYCQGDGCNGASSMTLSVFVAGIVTTVAFAANRL